MKKRFKVKRKITGLQIILFITIIISVFLGTIKIFTKWFTKEFNSEEYFKYLIKTGFNNQVDYTIFKTPIDILSSNIEMANNEVKEEEALVYIYNTHDEEEYQSSYLNAYNIKANVKVAAYYLQEKLKDLGVNSIVEEQSIRSILQKNNWIYKYSYNASRILLEEAKEKYPKVKLYIDLHRDSSVKEKTTVTMDNKNYAKVMFLVGLEHDNYEENLKETTKFNNILENDYPFLVRGIYKKSGPGVNGIYNQDFSKEVILIELGGQYNTIEEVSNTIDLLAKVINQYLEEL